MRTVNFIGIGVLGVFLSSCCLMPMMHGNHGQNNSESHEHTNRKAICPVCQMEFTATKDTSRVFYQGQTYYFDSDEHLREFMIDPDKYLKRH